MNKKIIGYQSILPIKNGDKVKIKKGVLLRSMHPSKNGWYENSRTRTVTVNHTNCGMEVVKCEVEKYYMQEAERALGEDLLLEMLETKGNHELIPVYNPSVIWAGTGGYWVECDINDVEKIE